MIEVRRATDEDVPALAGLLARAFTADPPFHWVIRDDATRLARLTTLFELAISGVFLPKGEIHVTLDGAGAALWEPRPDPTAADDDPSEFGEMLAAAGYLAEEVDRMQTYLGLMHDVHPDDPPHWYLGILGVDLARQGQGIGSAVMRPMLDRADAEGLACYLDSSNIKNVPLYERHGFRVVQVVDLPDDGPPFWSMWRDPRSV